MSEIILGRVAPVYQGEYNTTKSYEVLDRVTYNGKYYECIQNTEVGVAPSDIKHWVILGIIGVDGKIPDHKWDGTKLSFENPDGTYDDGVELKGDEGLSAAIMVSDSIEDDSSNVLATARAVKSSMTSIDNTAEELNDCPLGSILIWTGTLNGAGHPVHNGKTYTSWQLCNGRNGTPDLTGAMLIGYSATGPTGHTTGTDNDYAYLNVSEYEAVYGKIMVTVKPLYDYHNHSFITPPFTISSATATVDTMMAHAHKGNIGFCNGRTIKAVPKQYYNTAVLTTCNSTTVTLNNTSDNTTHTHSITESSEYVKELPYTCVYYIMKIKEQTSYNIKIADPINLHWFYTPVEVAAQSNITELSDIHNPINWWYEDQSTNVYYLGAPENNWYPGGEEDSQYLDNYGTSTFLPNHSVRPFFFDAGGDILIIDDNGKTYNLFDMYSNMRRGNTIDPSLDVQIQSLAGNNMPQIGIIDFLEDCTKSSFCVDYTATTYPSDFAGPWLDSVNLSIISHEVGTYYFGVTSVAANSNSSLPMLDYYCVWGGRSTLQSGTTRVGRPLSNDYYSEISIGEMYDYLYDYATIGETDISAKQEYFAQIEQRLPNVYRYTPKLFYNVAEVGTYTTEGGGSRPIHAYTLPSKMRLGCQFVDPTGNYPELHLLKKYLFNIDTTPIDNDWQTAYHNGNTVGLGTSVTLTNGDYTYEFTYPLNDKWIKAKLESMGYSTSYADGFYWGYKAGYYTKNNPTTDDYTVV